MNHIDRDRSDEEQEIRKARYRRRHPELVECVVCGKLFEPEAGDTCEYCYECGEVIS